MVTSVENAASAEHQRRPTKHRSQGLRSLAWLLVGATLAFDNFPVLYAVGGLTTGSVSIIAILALALLYRSAPTRQERWIIWATVGLLVFQVYSVLASFAMTPSLLDDDFLGESTIAKGARTAAIVLFWVLGVIVGVRIRRKEPRALALIGLGLLAVNVYGLAIQIGGWAPSGAQDWSHAISWFDRRPRGFKFESSTFGASFLCAAALIHIGAKLRPLATTLLFVFTAVCAILTTSRGSLIALGGATVLVVVTLAVSKLRLNLAWRWWGAALTVAFLTISVAGVTFAANPVWSSFSSGQSDATRGGWGIVAIEAANTPPLGLNLVTYWNQVQPLIEETASTLTALYNVHDLAEFQALSSGSTDSGLTPKTLPALLAIWFGWPGLIAAALLLSAATLQSMKPSKFRLGAAVFTAATALSLAIYIPGIFMYESALVIGASLIGATKPNTRGNGEDSSN